ncbi:MAG: Crp/Fnr family transcriptional regulator [Chloroflexi bacterium]|nr:Crp/Fnr family transcriptional regulator [Chloroflexota bacterium]
MYASIARHPLFGDVSERDLTMLEGALRLQTFQAGEVIFRRGDHGTGVYFVEDGTVKIAIATSDMRENVIALMSAGECFGELAVFDREPRSASAIAVEETKTVFVPAEAFLAFVRTHPEVALRIILLLSRRLRQTDEVLASMVFFDVYGRVAKKLLELAGSHGQRTDHGVRINIALTQQNLANLVGASRESVNKVLKFFRDKGYISVVDRQFIIREPERLAQRGY